MKETVIDIQKFLPHRKPMLMVDYITELTASNVKTVFKIESDNLLVDSEFFSESGLIENAAQTCSAIVGQTFFLDEKGDVKEDVEVIGFISGIKKATVYQLPQINETIRTEALLSSRFDTEAYSICTMLCNSFLNNELIFEAEINLIIQEK